MKKRKEIMAAALQSPGLQRAIERLVRAGEGNEKALQERAQMFVGPGVDVYKGMIVGANARDNDMIVNPCKKKHLTNMRASTSDDTIRLSPHRNMSLEDCIEFLSDNELVEVTPKTIRLRKRLLDETDRKREDRARTAEAV